MIKLPFATRASPLVVGGREGFARDLLITLRDWRKLTWLQAAAMRVPLPHTRSGDCHLSVPADARLM